MASAAILQRLKKFATTVAITVGVTGVAVGVGWALMKGTAPSPQKIAKVGTAWGGSGR